MAIFMLLFFCLFSLLPTPATNAAEPEDSWTLTTWHGIMGIKNNVKSMQVLNSGTSLFAYTSDWVFMVRDAATSGTQYFSFQDALELSVPSDTENIRVKNGIEATLKLTPLSRERLQISMTVKNSNSTAKYISTKAALDTELTVPDGSFDDVPLQELPFNGGYIANLPNYGQYQILVHDAIPGVTRAQKMWAGYYSNASSGDFYMHYSDPAVVTQDTDPHYGAVRSAIDTEVDIWYPEHRLESGEEFTMAFAVNTSDPYLPPTILSVLPATTPAEPIDIEPGTILSVTGTWIDADSAQVKIYAQLDDLAEVLLGNYDNPVLNSEQPFSGEISLPADLSAGNHTLTFIAEDSESVRGHIPAIMYLKYVEAPTITASDIEVVQDSIFDPLVGVTAFDRIDGNLTSAIAVVENTVETSTPGNYSVTYSVTNSSNKTATKSIKVSVLSNAVSITEQYQNEAGMQIAEVTTTDMTMGSNYSTRPKFIEGYQYIGYKIDAESTMHTGNPSIDQVGEPHAVIFVYREATLPATGDEKSAGDVYIATGMCLTLVVLRFINRIKASK